MRKHVTPADPAATIPDPARGRDLPPDGDEVEWSAHWALLAGRGDVIVRETAPDKPPRRRSEPVADHQS